MIEISSQHLPSKKIIVGIFAFIVAMIISQLKMNLIYVWLNIYYLELSVTTRNNATYGNDSTNLWIWNSTLLSTSTSGNATYGSDSTSIWIWISTILSTSNAPKTQADRNGHKRGMYWVYLNWWKWMQKSVFKILLKTTEIRCYKLNYNNANHLLSNIILNITIDNAVWVQSQESIQSATVLSSSLWWQFSHAIQWRTSTEFVSFSIDSSRGSANKISGNITRIGKFYNKRKLLTN